MSIATIAIPAPVKAAFDALHAKLVGEWTALKANLVAAGWLSFNPSSLAAAAQFLLHCVDELTGLADSSGLVNQQKKEAVIAYVLALYETVIAVELPTVAIGPAKLLEPEIAAILGGVIEFAVAKLHGKSPVPLPVQVP